MAIPFLAMAAAAALRGGSSALSAFGAESANKRNATAGALQRRRLMNLIAEINNRDLSGLDAQASDVMSRASDQIEATAAQRGTLRAPNAGAPRAMSEAFTQILAQLAGQRTEDQRMAQSLIAEIYGDPSFAVPDPSNFNPGFASLIAGLGGAAGGAGEVLGNFAGTEAGAKAFGGTPKATGWSLSPSQVRFNDWYQQNAARPVGR